VNIRKATGRYEAWLARHLRIVGGDLDLKHRQMRLAPFPFLRATYYRWAQLWPEVCEDEAGAPRTLAVGDLHVENFGSWRDKDGRLVWGINDFDEAWPLAYTNDLVRLTTSALLANLDGSVKQGAGAILEGYREALEAGGQPYVLAERHTALRLMATARLHDPERYWAKLRALPELKDPAPAGAVKALESLMPVRGLEWRLSNRVAGLGSLGRQRYVALADWCGGSVAREAKALAPSACLWAETGKGAAPIRYQEAIDHAVRCPDPFVRLRKRWIVRRLAPDCSRIELSDLPRERDVFHLLHAMGWETANIHLGSAKPRVLLRDLGKRPAGWLLKAANRMRKAILADFKDYRK
jgi:hypothetical protein